MSSTGRIRMTRRSPRFETAIEILEKLVQSHPDQARLHGELGRSYNGLGYLHDELRHNLPAIPAFEKAVKQQERAIALSPDDDEYKIYRSNHLENLGEQYVDLGQVDRGLPYYKDAIRFRRQLLAAAQTASLSPRSRRCALRLGEHRAPCRRLGRRAAVVRRRADPSGKRRGQHPR